jgi:hypothetical protein
MNYLALMFTLCVYFSFGIIIDIAITAPLISEYNRMKDKKIPFYLIIFILIITPLIYPFAIMIFCITVLFSIFKERFHDYFNLD